MKDPHIIIMRCNEGLFMMMDSKGNVCVYEGSDDPLNRLESVYLKAHTTSPDLSVQAVQHYGLYGFSVVRLPTGTFDQWIHPSRQIVSIGTDKGRISCLRCNDTALVAWEGGLHPNLFPQGVA